MKNEIKPISIVLLLIINIALFTLLYSLLHTPSVVLVSVLFVGYLSWSKGTVNGLILAGLNWVTTALFIMSVDPKFNGHIPREAVINISVQILFAILLGSYGSVARRLRSEIETRKQAEAQLKEYQNHLEEKVEKRTRELEEAHERLHQAEKMESIGQLAGGIAHDFNNHLNIILGYSGIMLNNNDRNSQNWTYAHRIEKTGQTAAELTKQLLLFARKEAITFESLDVNELVQNTVSLLSHSIQKNITIRYAPDAEVLTIKGGKAQIQNALFNLAFNARDAMETGGTLTFTTNKTEVTEQFCDEKSIECKPGTYVVIAVTDTGCGIQHDVMKHIFEPFFTTKESGKGTGMGLATVYGIAKSHCGAVYASTQPDRGTTFSLLFPAD